MDPTMLTIVGLFIVVLFASTAYSAYKANTENQATQSLRNLQAIQTAAKSGSIRQVNEALKSQRKKSHKKQELTLEEKMFQAGMFSLKDKADFRRSQKVLPIVCAVLFGLAAYLVEPPWTLICLVLGVAIGFQAPFSILDWRIKARHDEMMYFLPLVVEQLVVGVSSSLDIGPVLQRVADLADERNSHNPISELIKIVQHYVRSGVALPDALIEVGRASGHNEVKHTFLSLAQVVQHGGEVSKRLMEMADSVAAMRETQVEEKIKKLELVATGPVGLVFLGFLGIILTGFGMQLVNGMKTGM